MATNIYQNKTLNMEIIRYWNWKKTNRDIRQNDEYIVLIAKNNIFEGIRGRY